MQYARNRCDISFIINAHREGLLLVPALRSALAAKAHCENGASPIRVEIVLVGDEVDAETARIIDSYRGELDKIALADYGNLADARMHAINMASGQFVCFLDGDDLWQPSWPARAYAFALSRPYCDTIFHTEVFAGFGDERFLRRQIGTNDALFHLLHLFTTWHFCNNLFAHRAIFARFPIVPYNLQEGFGSEDWHWSCETLAGGIQREFVPQTVYFYRQDRQAKIHLSRGRGRALRPTSLFRARSVLESYPSFIGWSQPPSEEQVRDATLLRFEASPEAWLAREVKIASEIEFELFKLREEITELKVATPTLQHGIAYVVSAIALHAEHQPITLLGVDCDDLPAQTLQFVKLGIRQSFATVGRAVVFCGDTVSKERLLYKDGAVLYVNYKMLLRVNSQDRVWLFHLLSNLISQYKVDSLINFNSFHIDFFTGEAAALLRTCGVRTARVFFTNLHDVIAGSGERSILANIGSSTFKYDELWTWRRETHSYLSAILAGRTTAIKLGAAVSAEMLTLDAINRHALTIAYDQVDHRVQRLAEGKRDRCDISCVLNLHREGDLVVPTLRSMQWMFDQASLSLLDSELIVVLDDADRDTALVIERLLAISSLPAATRVIEVNNHDLGRSRMAGVEVARGHYVGLFDGDDLYSDNWLTEAANAMRQFGSRAVCHPEINIYFGADHRLMWHPDETTFPVPYGGLLFENCWSSLSFAERELYLKIPLLENSPETGFGYEDWHWNLTAIASGIVHRTVPRTCHFVRLKGERSLNRTTAQRLAVVRPSNFFAQFMRDEIHVQLAPSKQR